MPADDFFSLAHPEFYDSPAYYRASPEYAGHLETLLPDDWQLQRDSIWLHAACPSRSSNIVQGFKVHLSCTPAQARRLLDIAVPLCVARSIPFKIAGDPRLHALLNSKPQARGSSGKFMTIYPGTGDLFHDILEALYAGTAGEDLAGPFILSDRRYKDSRVIYYRYGGFHSPFVLNADGTQTPCLLSPDGNPVPDRRLPYFELPPWITDPFGDPFGASPATDAHDAGLLDGRYRVEGALSFSNAGGVYAAVDTVTGDRVVIKEARPLTNFWSTADTEWDAVFLLRHEHDVLTRLAHLSFVPRPINFFQEWEHSFLVEQRVDGVTLNAFWTTRDLVFAPHVRQPGAIESFLPQWRHVAERLVAMVRAIHASGVLLGDLSPRNVLIDAATLDMWVIDFESAAFMEESTTLGTYAAQWGTPGFMRPARTSRSHLEPADDYYAIAMILYNAIVPANDLFALNPRAEALFLDNFLALGLPSEVKTVIACLTEGQPDAALDALSRVRVASPPASASASASAPAQPCAAALDRVRSMTQRMADYILATADYERRDRLWPAHHQVFATNPLSVAHGACGVSLFLQEAIGEVPDPVREWLMRQVVSPDRYSPGLYVGMAGVASTWLAIQEVEKAEEIMRMLYESPLLYKEPGMFVGVAGWGLVSVQCYLRTGRQGYLDKAIEAGEHLLRTAEPDGDCCAWRCAADGLHHYGYGYGASGIALFLLYLHAVTGREDFRRGAVAGLEFDLASRQPGERWEWKRFEGDTLLYPYWIHGSAGIAAIALRFARVLDDARYRDIARAIGADTFVKYSYTPGLFEGLAGIGELMIDVCDITGDETFYDKALDIADTIGWFSLERPEGTAFPGRWLDRISNDYGTGAAGIGLFFTRLLRRRPRLFADIGS